MQSAPSNEDITGLLQAWTRGDRTAEEALWPAVFVELQRIAHRHMARERMAHTLQTGAVVNELYVRLTQWDEVRWQNRAHFFGMCARMMRQILIDYARARGCGKRAAVMEAISLDGALTISASKGEALLVLDDALQHLAVDYPRQSSVVEMRFFGGLSVEETAEALQVSAPTVIRDWGFARAWLSAHMTGQNSGK